jgi:hypothetical protein
VSLPPWLFDELADRLEDDRELLARATAWSELLEGAEEVDLELEAHRARDAELLAEWNRRRARWGLPPATELPGMWRGEGVDLERYRKLRARAYPGLRVDLLPDGTIDAPGWPARGDTEHTGYWPSTVEIEPDETVYVNASTAVPILEISTQKVYALRRRGELRSIGMTATEYKRARELAGWGDASGWGPGVWFLREDVEALARAREAA